MIKKELLEGIKKKYPCPTTCKEENGLRVGWDEWQKKVIHRSWVLVMVQDEER